MCLGEYVLWDLPRSACLSDKLDVPWGGCAALLSVVDSYTFPKGERETSTPTYLAARFARAVPIFNILSCFHPTHQAMSQSMCPGFWFGKYSHLFYLHSRLTQSTLSIRSTDTF